MWVSAWFSCFRSISKQHQKGCQKALKIEARGSIKALLSASQKTFEKGLLFGRFWGIPNGAKVVDFKYDFGVIAWVSAQLPLENVNIVWVLERQRRYRYSLSTFFKVCALKKGAKT